jgi:cysteine sulfinate desulfinase/cysteine desulfurase-like protein
MIYLDNHATTKIDKAVLKKMNLAEELFFGNYSSNHIY